LGFEESGQTSDVIDAKKLSLLVADIFPLLRKYPDWDMSDTNQIRYLTRHMHEQQLSTDSVQTAADFLRAAGGNEDEVAILSKSSSSSFSGVLPPTMELQNVPLSPFACMNETQDANALAKLGSTHLAANEHGLPEYFDAREAFPDCSRLLGTVRDQGKCGSCWAVAATEVMNDRLCVATQGNDSAELSPQYALSCYESGHGCQGGDVYSTLAIAFEKGVPKGGMLDKSACLPYEFEPCDHPCMVAGTMPATCPATCADGSPLTFVYPKSMPYVCPEGDTLCIAKEIQAHGSVAVTFGPVYPDFYNFQDGVYKVPDSADEPLGEHATKLIGWGKTDEGEHYWIMVNSWRNWGDNGIGRVRMGEMNMESGIVAVDM
jgi:cathepsin B